MKRARGVGRRTATPRSTKHSQLGLGPLVLLGFVAIFATYFSLAAYYLDQGVINSDESFYALASRNVMDGRVPYLHFGYTQMPLLPYINGAAMQFCGWGLNAQRAVNLVWGALGLLAVVLALRHRLGRWEPGFVAAFTVAASPYWAQFQAMGKTYALAGMFMALATGAMLLRWPLERRAALVGLLGTLAAGCRLSLAPVVAIYVAALLVEATRWRARLRVLGICVGIPAALLLPFLLATTRNMIFFVWEYHLATVFMRRGVKQLVEWWQIAPAAVLVLVAALFALPALVRGRRWTESALLVAALGGLALPMVPASAYGEYIVPMVLAAAAAGIAAMWSVWPMEQVRVRHVVWALPLLVLLHPLPRTATGLETNNEKIRAIMTFANRALAFRLDPGRERTSTPIQSIAAFLEARVPDGSILTPMPIVAVESGREIMPGTDMGMFSVMGPEDEERAAQLNVVTLDGIIAMVHRREPAAIVLLKGPSRWNFKWMMPTLRRQPQALQAEFERAVQANYVRAHEAGHLELFVRK